MMQVLNDLQKAFPKANICMDRWTNKWDVYVSNGEIIGTKKFISSSCVDKDLENALKKVFESLKAKRDEKQGNLAGK